MCGFYISKVRETSRMVGKGVRRRDVYRMGGREGREVGGEVGRRWCVYYTFYTFWNCLDCVGNKKNDKLKNRELII